MNSSIKIQKTFDVPTPEYQTEGAAGFDLHVAKNTCCLPGCVTLVNTGLKFEIPRGYHLDIRPRSGLSLVWPGYVANSPGTIDSDYRGEVQVMFFNPTGGTIELKRGTRIAQGIILPHVQVAFREAELNETKRGAGGFGSTGE